MGDLRHGGSCSIFASLDNRRPPAYRFFHRSDFALLVNREDKSRTGSHPRVLAPNRIKTKADIFRYPLVWWAIRGSNWVDFFRRNAVSVEKSANK